MKDIAIAQTAWAQAQQLPNQQRWEAELAVINALAGADPHLAALGVSALSRIAEEGDRPGWAFAHGFSVSWFPTRGAAKHAWHLARSWARNQVGGPGLEALGPQPQRCSLREALIWGRGSC